MIVLRKISGTIGALAIAAAGLISAPAEAQGQLSTTACNRIVQNCIAQQQAGETTFDQCWADNGEPYCSQRTGPSVPLGGGGDGGNPPTGGGVYECSGLRPYC
jgi:hypothetical protein